MSNALKRKTNYYTRPTLKTTFAIGKQANVYQLFEYEYEHCDQQLWSYLQPFVRYKQAYIVKEWRDLEWVRGCSKLLKMAPFNRPYTTFYWSAIVNIGLQLYLVGLPFLSYLTLNNIVTSKSFQRSLKVAGWCRSKAQVRFPIRLPQQPNYGSILHHFRDKARYWSKIVIFSYPGPCIRRFRSEGSMSEYCHPVSYAKTRMTELYLTVKKL